MYLSIVIPAYNEEDRIGTSLTKIYNFLKKRNYDFEIIVVDDGSKDKTLNLLSEYSQNIPNLIVLKNESNQGKGFSVKKGVLNSKGDIILFTDADLSTPIGELDKLIYWLDEGYPISIGSRDLPESQVNRHQAWYREFMGKIFNRIIRLILNLDYHDTQCGFKCFRNDAALEIFKCLRLCGFSFDVEVLFIAKHLGIKVKEVPVRWYNSPESKVKIIRDSSKMLWDILKLRFNNFKD
jgi:dolichyl-phosphate beta-glucosyltransferase